MLTDFITTVFVLVDDFCKIYAEYIKKRAIESKPKVCRKPTRVPEITESEIITIMLLYQRVGGRDFKSFYNYHLKESFKSAFPKLPTYERFIELRKRVLPIMETLMYCILKKNSDELYIDSTPIRVCNNKRIHSHKVFKGLAARGKSTIGWFFGFKLHICIDSEGNLVSVTLTRGNCDDRVPVEELLKGFQGLVCGDKGYLSQELFEKLLKKGIKLITGIKNKFMILKEKMVLRKRSLVESVFSCLKRNFELEHSRHRSVIGFLLHI